MSRRIKDFGYTEFVKDTMEVDADTIKDMEFPGIRIECFQGYDFDEYELENFRLTAYAEEDKPGIHFKLVKLDSHGEPTNESSKEIIADEIKVVDSLYEEVCKGNTATDSKCLQEIAVSLMRDYALNNTQSWYYDIDYEGICFIYTNEQVIGIAGAITFKDQEVILKHCVGSMNLDQIENCTIQCAINGRNFILTEFKQKSMIGETENLNQYILQEVKGMELQDEIPVELYKDFVQYSPETEEEYVRLRQNFLKEQNKKTQNVSTFADFADDLL